MKTAAAAARTARLLALSALLLCHGCAYWSGLQHTYSAQALPAQEFQFGDGGHAIYFSFDKSVQQLPAAASTPAITTYLFVLAGSDCTSMKYFLPQYFDGLDGRSGALRIFVLHKRFIEERSWGRLAGCGDDFIDADHAQRWLADQEEFIRVQLAAAARTGMSLRRVVLLGISEGADIVPTLAQRLPEVTHAVLLGNGGMAPLAAYRLQAAKHGFADQLAALAPLESAPVSGGDQAQRLLGRSWRYWKELQALPHRQSLLQLHIPLMVAMGEADRAVPIESAWYLRDLFAAHGKQNLTLITYPRADHGLRNESDSMLPDFSRSLDYWLDK